MIYYLVKEKDKLRFIEKKVRFTTTSWFRAILLSLTFRCNITTTKPKNYNNE